MPRSRVLAANEDANMPYSDSFTGARYQSGRHETDAQVLHAAHNKSTVAGIDVNLEKDQKELMKTVEQILTWAWASADRKSS